MEVSLLQKIFFDKNGIMNDRWRCHFFFLLYFLKWNNKILRIEILKMFCTKECYIKYVAHPVHPN